MTYLIIAAALYVLSGIFDAVMDNIKDHYNKSILDYQNGIFEGLTAQWWNPAISWKNKYVDYDADVAANVTPRLKVWVMYKMFGISFVFLYFQQFSDAWHFFKMLKEICCGVAIVVAAYSSYLLGIDWRWSVVYLLTLGVLRNLAFNLFYNKILVIK